MGFASKYSILNEQVIYTEKSKLNIADMRLIPLDRVILLDRVTNAVYKPNIAFTGIFSSVGLYSKSFALCGSR